MRNGREGYDLASIAFGYPSERHWLSKGQPMLVRGSAPKTLGSLLTLHRYTDIMVLEGF